MEEVVEICKLRLFLKLVAQVDDVSDLEPLPDIDFNIRAGNTLVGYATRKDVRAALGRQQHLGFDDALERIEEQAEEIDRKFQQFRLQQTTYGGGDHCFRQEGATVAAERVGPGTETAILLTSTKSKRKGFKDWLASHKPFHWFVEFHEIMAAGRVPRGSSAIHLTWNTRRFLTPSSGMRLALAKTCTHGCWSAA